MPDVVIEHPLRGVIPPMVTPLAAPDQLDLAGLERLIEHLVAGGVHGIFVLGTTGEGPSLSYRLRRELIERACRLVAGRVPVLVGVTDSSFQQTVRLAQHSAEQGAAAVVLAPPFYFPIDESDLESYFRSVIPELPLPAYLYNMPTHTKSDFSPGLVKRMLSIGQIVGLKDSAPGATCFHAVREHVARHRPEFSLLIGPEHLMAQCVRLGAHGGVCGGANAFPRLFVDLYAAAAAGNEPETIRLQRRVESLAATVYAAGGGAGYASLRAIKRALAYQGVCRDEVAPPLRDLSGEQRSRVDQQLDAFMSSPPRLVVDVHVGANGDGRRIEETAQ